MPSACAQLTLHNSQFRDQYDAHTLAVSLLRLLDIVDLSVLVAAWTSRNQPSGAKTFPVPDGDQADIVQALAERLSLQQGPCGDTGHLTPLHSPDGRQQSFCMLSSDRARVLCPPTLLADRAVNLARLHSMLPCSCPPSGAVSALKPFISVVRPNA